MELVSDVIMDPPAKDKYDSLKKILIERCQDSEERRLDAILNKVDLGDSCPSEFFRKMESLAGDFKLINKPLLKKLWIGKLPSTIQACLIAIEGSQTQEELFNIADKLHNATERPKISVIKHESSDDISSFKNILERINNRLNNLENSDARSRRDQSHNSRSHSRNRSNNRSRNNSTKRELC